MHWCNVTIKIINKNNRSLFYVKMPSVWCLKVHMSYFFTPLYLRSLGVLKTDSCMHVRVYSSVEVNEHSSCSSDELVNKCLAF